MKILEEGPAKSNSRKAPTVPRPKGPPNRENHPSS